MKDEDVTMTDATPGTGQGWPSTPRGAPPMPRPGLVTAAGVVELALSVVIVLMGLVLLLGAGLFAGVSGSIPVPPEAPAIGGILGALAGAILVYAIIVIAYGVLQFVVGLNVLGRRGWARVTGLVLAVIGALFAAAGLTDGDQNGTALLIGVLAANAFVIYALATTGPWFAPDR